MIKQYISTKLLSAQPGGGGGGCGPGPCGANKFRFAVGTNSHNIAPGLPSRAKTVLL